MLNSLTSLLHSNPGHEQNGHLRFVVIRWSRCSQLWEHAPGNEKCDLGSLDFSVSLFLGLWLAATKKNHIREFRKPNGSQRRKPNADKGSKKLPLQVTDLLAPIRWMCACATWDSSSYYPVTEDFNPVGDKIVTPDLKLNFIQFKQCQGWVSDDTLFVFLLY